MFKPRIKKHLDVIPEATGGFYIRSSESISVLKGTTVSEVVEKLLPLLDGNVSEGEIIQRLENVARPEIIRAILGKLKESRIIEDAAEETRQEFKQEELDRYRHQLVFFDLALHSGHALDYQLNLKNAKLALIGAGSLALSLAKQAASMGIGRIVATNLGQDSELILTRMNPEVDASAPGLPLSDWEKNTKLLREVNPTLLVLALDSLEPAITDSVNALAIEMNWGLLNCQTNGTEGIVGPLVVPGQTACLKCHHLRVMRNLDFHAEHYAWEKWIRAHPERRAITAQITPFTDMIAGMAAIEILKHTSGCYEAETYGKYLAVNALTFEVIPHHVLRIPRCPGCGNARDKNTFSPWREL